MVGDLAGYQKNILTVRFYRENLVFMVKVLKGGFLPG